MTVHDIAEILNKFGFALVLGGLFIWNSVENGDKLDKLQVEYRESQRLDREEYIKLNKEMIETLGVINGSMTNMASQLKDTNNRLQQLETEIKLSTK